MRELLLRDIESQRRKSTFTAVVVDITILDEWTKARSTLPRQTIAFRNARSAVHTIKGNFHVTQVSDTVELNAPACSHVSWLGTLSFRSAMHGL